ncbi:MAG: hypothetical protein PXY39_03165 [archaeon]|nr:hypothetical protein [archaeon]
MSFNDDEDSAKKALRSYAANEQRESSVKNFKMNTGAATAAEENRRTAYREQQTKDLIADMRSNLEDRIRRRQQEKLPFPGSKVGAKVAHRVKSGLKDFGADVKRGFNGYSVGRKINQTIVEGIRNPFDEEDRRPRISVVVNNAAEAPKRKRSFYSNYNTLPSPEEIMGVPRRSPSSQLQQPQRTVVRSSLPTPQEIMGTESTTTAKASAHHLARNAAAFGADMFQQRSTQTKQRSPPAVGNNVRSFRTTKHGVEEVHGGKVVKLHTKGKRKVEIHDYRDPFEKFRLF